MALNGVEQSCTGQTELYGADRAVGWSADARTCLTEERQEGREASDIFRWHQTVLAGLLPILLFLRLLTVAAAVLTHGCQQTQP